MKKISVLACVLATVVLASSAPAMAKGGMLKACKKDLKKFSCDAKDEAAAHECLEKHEEHGKKNDGFSHACYEAHEAYEKKMNKEEKGEEKGEAKGEEKGEAHHE